jgi:hypothetical protein
MSTQEDRIRQLSAISRNLSDLMTAIKKNKQKIDSALQKQTVSQRALNRARYDASKLFAAIKAETTRATAAEEALGERIDGKQDKIANQQFQAETDKALIAFQFTDGTFVVTKDVFAKILDGNEDNANRTWSGAYIKEFVQTHSTGLLDFKGFITADTSTPPAYDFIDATDYWYVGNINDALPWNVYGRNADNTAWDTSKTISYPDTLWDLWTDETDHHGYYRFGGEWNILDFTINMDDYYTKEQIDNMLLGYQPKLNGIGYVKQSGASTDYVESIQDADIASAGTWNGKANNSQTATAGTETTSKLTTTTDTIANLFSKAWNAINGLFSKVTTAQSTADAKMPKPSSNSMLGNANGTWSALPAYPDISSRVIDLGILSKEQLDSPTTLKSLVPNGKQGVGAVYDVTLQGLSYKVHGTVLVSNRNPSYDQVEITIMSYHNGTSAGEIYINWASGTTWQGWSKITAPPVTSVNGRTGAVTELAEKSSSFVASRATVTDCDTALLPGNYYFENSGPANRPADTPTKQYGVLICLGYAYDTSHGVVQIYRTHSTPGQWIRSRWSNVWTAWSKLGIVTDTVGWSSQNVADISTFNSLCDSVNSKQIPVMCRIQNMTIGGVPNLYGSCIISPYLNPGYVQIEFFGGTYVSSNWDKQLNWVAIMQISNHTFLGTNGRVKVIPGLNGANQIPATDANGNPTTLTWG